MAERPAQGSARAVSPARPRPETWAQPHQPGSRRRQLKRAAPWTTATTGSRSASARHHHQRRDRRAVPGAGRLCRGRRVHRRAAGALMRVKAKELAGDAEIWDGTNLAAIQALAGDAFVGTRASYVLIRTRDGEICHVRPGWAVTAIRRGRRERAQRRRARGALRGSRRRAPDRRHHAALHDPAHRPLQRRGLSHDDRARMDPRRRGRHHRARLPRRPVPRPPGMTID